VRAPRLFAAAPTGDLKAPPAGEAGADGDSWLENLEAGGPDVNPALSGALKFPEYDAMRKTDPTIKAVLLFQKLPVRSAQWALEEAEENSPPARLAKDFVCENLGFEEHEGELDMSPDEVLQHLLTTLDFGPALGELVWDDVREWHDADGDPHLVRRLARIAPRMPSSIERVKREKGRIVEVTQNIPGTKPIRHSLERPKLVHLVYEREGSRWDGVSQIRPAWGPWYFKKNLIISAGIGWDRFAAGLPVIYHPSDEEELAKQIGRSIRQHERGYAHFPSRGGPSPNTGGRPDSDWFLEILNAAHTIADPVALLRWCSEQEAEALLAHFSSLGRTGTGAYSVGEVQIDPFFLAVQALARYVCDQIQRQIIRPLVEVNFGVESAKVLTPKLTVSKVTSKSLETIVKAHAMLADSGVDIGFGLHPSDRNKLRSELSMEPLEDEYEANGVGMRARVLAAVKAAGIDQAGYDAVVAQLPREVTGRNGREGDGLARR
jgi:hypothetical protein